MGKINSLKDYSPRPAFFSNTWITLRHFHMDDSNAAVKLQCFYDKDHGIAVPPELSLQIMFDAHFEAASRVSFEIGLQKVFPTFYVKSQRVTKSGVFKHIQPLSFEISVLSDVARAGNLSTDPLAFPIGK